MTRSGWDKRIGWAEAVCLTPGCVEASSANFKRRWCDPHGEQLERVRMELGYGRSRSREAMTAPVSKRKPPEPQKPTRRLAGCDKTPQKPGGACYLHRTVAADVTEAPPKRVCNVPNCDRAVRHRGVCREHIGNEWATPIRKPGPRGPRCDVDGCQRAARNKAGRCQKHPMNPRG
jgi:hypothetical protein